MLPLDSCQVFSHQLPIQFSVWQMRTLQLRGQGLQVANGREAVSLGPDASRAWAELSEQRP